MNRDRNDKACPVSCRRRRGSGPWNSRHQPGFTVIIASLLSVFLVIALGWVLKRSLLKNEEAWQGLETLSYYVLVPVLLIHTLAHAKLGTVPFMRLAGTLLGTASLMASILLVFRPLLEKWLLTDSPGFTSIFQGALRWNSFIALAIAANLYGNEGVTLTAVAIASLIPVLNTFAILVLRKYGHGQGSLMRGLMGNPFILGTLAGIVLNITGFTLPLALDLTLDILGKCALGIGLMLVGAGLRLQDIHQPSRAGLAGVALRLIGAPLLGFGLGRIIGLSGSTLVIAIICLGVPNASASYVLARKMGGDAPLMAAITTMQTLASMLTLPILIALLT
jgi:malonate transporter and related proteins